MAYGLSCDDDDDAVVQVFSVNNVNVVIRTRTEHLTDEEKARIKSECLYDKTVTAG